jgi:hypothetical protein
LDNEKLAAQLAEKQLDELCYVHDDWTDSIWREGKNERPLLAIVSDSVYDDYARFLASEILFEKKKNYPVKELEEPLAPIYANALLITGAHSSNSRLCGNLWGFMYNGSNYGNSNHDVLGTHLIKIGKKAVPYLVELLDDKELIAYIGSQEATTGNSYKYRVKDAAAYYIGEILGIPVKFHESFDDRDEEVYKLACKLRQEIK